MAIDYPDWQRTAAALYRPETLYDTVVYEQFPIDTPTLDISRAAALFVETEFYPPATVQPATLSVTWRSGNVPIGQDTFGLWSGTWRYQNQVPTYIRLPARGDQCDVSIDVPGQYVTGRLAVATEARQMGTIDITDGAAQVGSALVYDSTLTIPGSGKQSYYIGAQDGGCYAEGEIQSGSALIRLIGHLNTTYGHQSFELARASGNGPLPFVLQTPATGMAIEFVINNIAGTNLVINATVVKGTT